MLFEVNKGDNFFETSRKRKPSETPLITSDQTQKIVEKYTIETFGEEAVPLWNGEKDCLLIFTPQSRRYLETRDDMDLWIGPGMCILDKRTAAIYPYGSSPRECEHALCALRIVQHPLVGMIRIFYVARKMQKLSEGYFHSLIGSNCTTYLFIKFITNYNWSTYCSR